MALNDEEQKALEDKLKLSEQATTDALSEKDSIKTKHDTLLDEKKKFKLSVKKLVGEDTEELSEAQIVERLTAIKTKTKEAVKKGEESSEEYAALLAKQEKLEQRVEDSEGKADKKAAAEAYALKETKLTKELAKKDVTGEQLEDALEIAMIKLKGKEDVNYSEFVEEFLEKRPHLVASGFNDGVVSKVKKQTQKDAKTQAEAIQAKLNSGQRVSPAEMKKLEAFY